MAKENISQYTSLKSMDERLDLYWQASKKVFYILTGIWLMVTFGFGIVLNEWLMQVSVFNFPLSYLYSEVAAMAFHLLLLVSYLTWMNRIKLKLGLQNKNPAKLTKARLREQYQQTQLHS
ncbi:DUF4212 domain-containing protein [Thalassomonas sp. M1454]|uniref:DUF4212 domain-containing protein n=1 Tax=Thalassomonas sp. M1454 TaxID=2594477 RepID=UPI00163D3F1D|nr:sodium/substrate symporter small subunit [Thalassomonas sp. M1454]